LGKAGRFDLAELEFRAAVEADPTNADAIANLGISLANLGRVDEVSVDFRNRWQSMIRTRWPISASA